MTSIALRTKPDNNCPDVSLIYSSNIALFGQTCNEFSQGPDLSVGYYSHPWLWYQRTVSLIPLSKSIFGMNPNASRALDGLQIQDG